MFSVVSLQDGMLREVMAVDTAVYLKSQVECNTDKSYKSFITEFH